MRIFEDVMEPGIDLIECQGYTIPDYLTIDHIQTISLSDQLNPAKLEPSTLYVYESSHYLTDSTGNIAFIDCELRYTSPTGVLRQKHPEYRMVSKNGRDAGHFGLSLGQHPSIAMEQDPYLNRYGIWRIFERYWAQILKSGESVRIIGVFVEGEDTFSPFWCIREEVGEEISEYIFTNDDEQ